MNRSRSSSYYFKTNLYFLKTIFHTFIIQYNSLNFGSWRNHVRFYSPLIQLRLLNSSTTRAGRLDPKTREPDLNRAKKPDSVRFCVGKCRFGAKPDPNYSLSGRCRAWYFPGPKDRPEPISPPSQPLEILLSSQLLLLLLHIQMYRISEEPRTYMKQTIKIWA